MPLPIPNISELSTLCKELARYVRDDTIAVLPSERAHLIQVIEPMSKLHHKSEQEQKSLLKALQSLLERSAATINMDRYYAFAKAITQARDLIERLLTNMECEPQTGNEVRTLSIYLKHQGLIDCTSVLQKGNYSHIVSAFQQGFLSVSEATDAIRALVGCQHTLQLCQINATSNSMPSRHVA